jgi:CheY-like chemotaxis protein
VTLPAEELFWRGGLGTEAARRIQWCDPHPFVYPHVIVPCERGVPRRYDRGEAGQPRIARNVCTVEFKGAVQYGRVPTDRGWALHVVAPIAAKSEGENWRCYAAIEIGSRSPPRSARQQSWIERFHHALALGATVGQAVSRANRGAPREDATGCEVGRRRGTVLVVDDDADIREALGECLRAEGFEVHLAVHGKHALDALKLGLHPSVIFLDLRMPVLSGSEVLSALRSSPRWRSIPVVVVTAEQQSDADDLDGAFAVLRKPTSLEAVLVVAEQAITEARGAA